MLALLFSFLLVAPFAAADDWTGVWTGELVLDGRGDEFHPVILSGYPGERAVLTSDGAVNVPIQVHGRHGIVENLVVASDREVKYDIIVTGDNAIVRNCVFFGPVHEDCVKIGDQADHCLLFNNDISGYGSQCVDNFGINILFRKNHVYHAGNWKANAFGTKGGTRSVVVASSIFHDLSGGISFGGTGNLELYRKDREGNLLHATTDSVAVNNTFYNIFGPAVDFQSCLNGVFEGNTIHDSAAGFRVGLAPEQFEGDWKELVVGLPATRGTVIRNNRLANIAGDAMFLVEERARGARRGRQHLLHRRRAGLPLWAEKAHAGGVPQGTGRGEGFRGEAGRRVRNRMNNTRHQA